MKPGPFASPEAPTRLDSPCPGFTVSTPWGKKPNNGTYWQARGHHTGQDYAAPAGTPVLAILDGTVRYLTDRVLGLVVLLYAEVDGNPVTFWFCHLSSRSHVPGTVKAGDMLGRVGMTGTGAAMGPHLHLEERHGHSASWAGVDFQPRW